MLEQNLSVLTDNKSVLTGLPDPPLSVRMDNLFNLKRENKFLHHDLITCINTRVHLGPRDETRRDETRPPSSQLPAPESCPPSALGGATELEIVAELEGVDELKGSRTDHN